LREEIQRERTKAERGGQGGREEGKELHEEVG